uniref:E3 ubiquitin-protein ligase TRIM71-like n=1 Tax=Crassostrea virginica TaxID=6565 RepID=A0A8B8BYM9_CRAVI|nr:E3 ubiquitin-protein ligase TRIM71-like [Crassostrea virginica]
MAIMDNDEENQTKVVRYSGTTETQSIQWNDDGQPLFISGRENVKHLTYNRNLDICVSDPDAHTVVVVDHAGKLRFRYTGSLVTSKERFDPRGVATDVQGRILIADCTNGRIHILDQDGHFLRCIDNCHLNLPCGLCLDSKNNLFVAELKER